jgi:MFS family permease
VTTQNPAGGYRRLLGNHEFRGLVLAQVTSETGDQVARVALAVLVLERLDSAFLAALAFALGFLPGLLGGSLLAPFADRMPRRRLMLLCDLLRAAVVALMALLAVDATPVWVLFVLLLAAEVATVPFVAARTAVLPDILPDPRDYLTGTGLTRVLYQVNQVLGLAGAGLVVHLLSPRWALGLDAGTFALSFLVLWLSLRPRPAPAPAGGRLAGLVADFRQGARLVFADQVLRILVLLGWSAAIFLIAAEGVALAYARQHGEPDLGGLLMASVPAGGAVGAWLVSRLPLPLQLRLVRPLAAAACVPLLLTGFDPPVPVALALWFVGGACQGFLVTVLATVNLLTPPGYRGRVNGLGAAGFSVANALSFLLVGFLADVFTPAAAVAAAGAAGLLILVPLWWAWPAQPLSRAVARALGRAASPPEAG